MKQVFTVVAAVMVLVLSASCKKKTYRCVCYENGVVANSNATVTAYNKSSATEGCNSITKSWGYDECKIE